jgi:Xaa-Pro aminopeptidase
MDEKDARLASFCDARGVDGIWIRRRANVAWLAGGADVHCNSASELGVASILWTREKKSVLASSIEEARLRAEELGSEWELAVTPWWLGEAAPSGAYATDWPDDVLCDLRAPLTAREVGTARALGADAADVVCRLMHDVRPGWSEHEAAGELTARLAERGIAAPVVLVAADERADRFRHPIPTALRCVRKLMVVLCAERRGLIVALTRLVHFGPLPEELDRKHDAVCRVDAALHAATRPGARWCDLLAVAQRAYAEKGFDGEWKLHHQGGPMGYAPRDFLATPSETRRVVERQLAGWNPSITGTKSEDTILSSGEVLTSMRDWPMRGSRPDILVR